MAGMLHHDNHCYYLLHSYALLQTKKEDFEHKYSHVLQILETERNGTWQLLQQCQDQAQQLKDLRQEVPAFIILLCLFSRGLCTQGTCVEFDPAPSPVKLRNETGQLLQQFQYQAKQIKDLRREEPC